MFSFRIFSHGGRRASVAIFAFSVAAGGYSIAVAQSAETPQPSRLADTLMSSSSPVAWPDPLVMRNGDPVVDVATFEGRRKPEIRRLFED
ncbi:hypothetical protein [Martelella mediterranea]|uniref:Uncharacterized protein n=1 Tax=Martelella mediterranea TaxID=293089 RepID=A0A4R3NJT7_9HYPH|nr:hypothetical protein [Martelella mediterranea]TCT29635.1 hypothetical protein EDC90_105011 [Martelella mediterranea]